MRFKNIVLGLVLAGTSGCGVTRPLRESERNLALLKPGMTRIQVAEAIGKPAARGGEQIDAHELYRSPRIAAACNAFVGFFTVSLTWWLPLCDEGYRKDWRVRYDEGGHMVDFH